MKNYHTHTYRCGHASGTEREYIEHAIAAGYTVIGFSEHAPHVWPDGFYSGFRIRAEQLDDYVTTLRALKEEYKDRIEVLIGFETEYYPAIFDAFLERIRPYDLDYLIMGQHFLGNEEDDMGCYSVEDDIAVFRRFVDQTIAGLKTGVFSYMAHPDMMTYSGDPAEYCAEMARLCEFGKRNDIPMEINLLGLKEGRRYPKEAMIRLCGEIGTPMIIGVDAHSPDRFDETEPLRQALELAEKYNVRLIDTPFLRRPNQATPLK